MRVNEYREIGFAGPVSYGITYTIANVHKDDEKYITA